MTDENTTVTVNGGDWPSRKDQLECEKLAAEGRKAAAEATEVELRVADKLASSSVACVYNFVGVVTEKAAKDCIQSLDMWSRRNAEADMTIVLNTPGGDVVDGLALYDFIVTDLRGNRGHSVTTVTRGYAASMGGVLLQAGSSRLIGPSAYVLIHEISSGTMGKVSEMEDRMEFSKSLQKRLLAILAERSTMTADEIAERWERKDWWLDADECVELGFADALG